SAISRPRLAGPSSATTPRVSTASLSARPPSRGFAFPGGGGGGGEGPATTNRRWPPPLLQEFPIWVVGAVANRGGNGSAAPPRLPLPRQAPSPRAPHLLEPLHRHISPPSSQPNRGGRF